MDKCYGTLQHGVIFTVSSNVSSSGSKGPQRQPKENNRGYCRGTYEGVRSWHDVLHVSNGVGLWAGFPIRLCNDASMTLITLRRK